MVLELPESGSGQKRSASVAGSKQALESLPTSEPVLTKVVPGRKRGVGEDFNAPENRLTPKEAREWVSDCGNIGFALGPDTRLVVVDVEEVGALPDEAVLVREEHALLEWESGHTGYNWLIRVTPDAYDLLDGVRTKIHLDGDGDHEVELLTNSHALGPGSVLGHEYCDEGKRGCPGEGRSAYELKATNREADDLGVTAARRLLEALGIDPEEADTSAVGHKWDGELPEPDDSLADEGELALRTLQQKATPAFNVLSDLLSGGTGRYEDLLVGEYGIDRSLQELLALTRLYGAIRHLHDVEDEERALAITRATFESYVRESQYTDDDQRRKWLTDGEDYREDRLRRAAGGYDLGKFQRFLNLNPVEDEWQRWIGDYSKATYGHVRFALDLLTGEVHLDQEDPDLDALRDLAAVLYGFDLHAEKLSELLEIPPSSVHGITRGGPGCIPPDAYPTKSEVVELARELDGEYNEEGSYGKALIRLRQRGVAALACVEEGVDYRYYPARLPGPKDACWVKCGGEERKPEPAEPSESNPRIVTDGGRSPSEVSGQSGYGKRTEPPKDNRYSERDDNRPQSHMLLLSPAGSHNSTECLDQCSEHETGG